MVNVIFLIGKSKQNGISHIMIITLVSVTVFLTGCICSLWSNNGVIKSCLDQASPSIMVIFDQDSKELPGCLVSSLTLKKFSAQCIMINHMPRSPFLQPLCSASQNLLLFSQTYAQGIQFHDSEYGRIYDHPLSKGSHCYP